ncbi:hypothetical protein J6W34_08805 [bacterium]|nr:hypothetical protein [bacterium]
MTANNITFSPNNIINKNTLTILNTKDLLDSFITNYRNQTKSTGANYTKVLLGILPENIIPEFI